MKNHLYLGGNKMLDGRKLLEAAGKFRTPFYLYDESAIIENSKQFMEMPNPFGLTVRYAMKANSNKAILQLLDNIGLHFDVSSLNEARRAFLAGVPFERMMYTSQELFLPADPRRRILKSAVDAGMIYNATSLNHLVQFSELFPNTPHSIFVRIHPGIGSGESTSRDTGSEYSSFGIHLDEMEQMNEIILNSDISINGVHVHVGSGSDPKKWESCIDRVLEIMRHHMSSGLSHIYNLNIGGGFKVARMPGETSADIKMMGHYAFDKLKNFEKISGRAYNLEVEPGTYIVANAGYIVTTVINKKRRGDLNFLILDGGMQVNIRPALYGSKHPFYVFSRSGELVSHEFYPDKMKNPDDFVVAGKCCESGDLQTIDSGENPVPRRMGEPNIGGYVVIGGAGAYCSSMTPFNYNSHTQIGEVLLRTNGRLDNIRNEQTLEQITANEHNLQSL